MTKIKSCCIIKQMQRTRKVSEMAVKERKGHRLKALLMRRQRSALGSRQREILKYLCSCGGVKEPIPTVLV